MTQEWKNEQEMLSSSHLKNWQHTLSKTLQRALQRGIKPPPKLKVSEWADRERRLSPEASAEPGKWHTDRAPFQREIMDAVNDIFTYRIVVMCSAQVGKTEILLNTLGYYMENDPAPTLFIQPTLDMAEGFSKDRLAPMFRDTPCLQNKVRDNRQKQSNNTLLHKKFPGGHITLAGANSPSSLASRPIRIVLCDEVDRYPKSAGHEGDPVSLAEKRTTTFFNSKVLLMSTPVTKGDSKIESEYEASDKRRFYVPCPHCRHKQVLKWGNITWDKDNPEDVHYRCEHCDVLIEEKYKEQMIRDGVWRAEKPFKGVAGFHLNELYSPWSSWKKIVREFLKVKNNPETLKTWVNTTLGETWEEKGDVPDYERLYERREDYKIGTLPDGVLFLTCGVDIQGDRLEAEVVGWGRGKESWSIEYRVMYGSPQETEVWRQLDKLISEQYLFEDGRTLPIQITAVDSGYSTQEVYNYCRKYPSNRVIAIKGSETMRVPIGPGSAVDLRVGGRRHARGFKVFPVGVNVLKSELYGWLKLPKPEDGKPFTNGYCHFPQYDMEFFKQLTAEKLIKRTVRGYSKYSWEKTRPRNEALDRRVYARAAASFYGMDRWQEHHWNTIANQLGSKTQKTLENVPKKGKIKRRPSKFL